MKYLATKRFLGLLSLFVTFTSLPLQAQEILEQANKLYELNSFKKAIVQYEAVLQQNVNETSVYGKLANCYRIVNDMPKAAQWYGRALQQTNQDPIYNFQYGLVLKALQKYAEAKQYFTKYAQFAPTIGKHYAETCDFALRRLKASSLYAVTNAAINSKNADFAPSFFQNTVIYASSRTDIKNGHNDGNSGFKVGRYNQLFISTPKSNGTLGAPQLLRSGLRTRLNEAPASFTADGRTVAYTTNQLLDGIRQIPSNGSKMRIYFADVVKPDQWEQDQPFTYNNPTSYSTGYPCLSPDGQTLYFASDMPGGRGGFDIYVSYKTGNNWSTPQNLGSEINTPGDEIAPFINGKVLYFSSDWHPGFGGFDIYRAEQSGGFWNTVSHLGNGVNSSYDDYSFIFNERKNKGYLVSNRPNGKGDADIYSVKTASERIELVILDDYSSLPVVGAKIDFTACNEGIVKTDNNGRFKFRALKGLNCKNVVISKAGYKTMTTSISAINRDMRLIEIRLTPEQSVEGQYVGTIVDIASQKGVSNVRIKVTNMTTNSVTETFSDSRGRYILNLTHETGYTLNYSKTGYLSTERVLNTKGGEDRTILGALAFERGKDKPITSADENETENEDNDGIRCTNCPPATDRTVPKIAFEIQVGVFSNPDKSRLNQLRTLGYVYSLKRRNGATAYRVGAYRTKAEANVIRSKIAERGYKDAYVRELKEQKLIKRVLIEKNKKNEPGPINRDDPKPRPGEETDTETPPTTAGIVFKLQLGAYQNPKFFDKSKVKDLGVISQYPTTKGLTLILLGNYKSYKAAKAAEKMVVAKGLPKPIVVVFKDGKRVSLKSVL